MSLYVLCRTRHVGGAEGRRGAANPPASGSRVPCRCPPGGPPAAAARRSPLTGSHRGEKDAGMSQGEGAQAGRGSRNASHAPLPRFQSASSLSRLDDRSPKRCSPLCGRVCAPLRVLMRPVRSSSVLTICSYTFWITACRSSHSPRTCCQYSASDRSWRACIPTPHKKISI